MKPINLDSDVKKETGFIIPVNYFETFSDRLMTKIPVNEVETISIVHKNKIWLYAAAAVLVVGISLPTLNNFFKKPELSNHVVLENYIINHSTISDGDIADLLTNKDVQKITDNLNLGDKTIENELSSNENIEEFLIN